MKTFKSLILLSVATAALAACTDEKSNSAAPAAPPIFAVSDFRADIIPTGAASTSYTDYVIGALSQLGVHQPFAGDILKSTTSGGRFSSQLSRYGQKALEQIRRNCAIRDGVKDSSGSLGVGQTLTSTSSSSVDGAYCPINYQLNQTGSLQITTRTATESSSTGTASISSKYQVTAQNFRSQNSVVEVSYNLNGQTFSTETFTNERESLKKEKRQFQGQMKIVLANGDVLSGPMYSETLQIKESRGRRKINMQNQVQNLLELNSPAGAVRILYIQDSQTRELRTAFINGRQIDPYLLAEFFEDTEIYSILKRR